MVLSSLVALTTTTTYASSFAHATLRLDRLRSATSTGGMVCAQTPSSDNGIESKIEVVFPSDFTLNTSTTNWTVTTSDIPNNATAWPGIGTATQVSGTTVTFPTANLSTSTLYCFNFSEAATTGLAGNMTGLIRTKASDNSVIDSTNYAVSILADDALSVTASIPPSPSDFNADLVALDSDDPIPQDHTITYRLTYGTTLSFSLPITLEVNWTKGTLSGSSIPTIDILEYVPGSASNAYNSTPPVINLLTKTISWSIPSFPANTLDKTVTFQLRTTSNYSGLLNVSFTANGRLLAANVQTPDSSVTKRYLYVPGPTSTPQPPSITPSVTPTPAPLKFSNVLIRSISKTEATVVATTNQPTSLTLIYGTNKKNLSKTVVSKSKNLEHFIKLDSLTPNTIYYFQIIAQNGLGKKITSDIYTFITAREKTELFIDTRSLIITSNKNIISTFNGTDINTPIALLPENTIFEFRIRLNSPQPIKSLVAMVRKTSVLGINTFDNSDQAGSDTIQMSELEPHIFAGKLRSKTPGIYELVIQIADYDGNVSEEKIGEIKVVKPFIVRDKTTNKGVENARIYLYTYNTFTRLFEPLSPQTLPIKNPVYSEPNGIVPLTLSFGHYKAQVSALGYKTHDQEFVIGPDQKDYYPQIYLEKDSSLPFLTAFSYYQTTLLDATNLTSEYITTLTASYRLFDLVSFTIILFFLITILVLFKKKTHVPISQIPRFVHLHFKTLAHKKDNTLLTGRVIDYLSRKPIAKALVVLFHAGVHVQQTTTTDKAGYFSFTHPTERVYMIETIVPGYEQTQIASNVTTLTNSANLQLELKSKQTRLVTVRETKELFARTVTVSFESLLMLCIIFEVIFIHSQGTSKTVPYLLLSLINLVIWIVATRGRLRTEYR